MGDTTERVFAVHVRNLVRHGAGRQGHKEVDLAQGDIDIARVLRILKERGYEGPVIPEHWSTEGNAVAAATWLRSIWPTASCTD